MKNGAYVALIILVISTDAVLSLKSLTKLFLNEDAVLNFTQLAYKYGHSSEEYDVTTDDGYIIKIFRIPGSRNSNITQPGLPIFLMHGILNSADTWILRGYESLAITLANAGFDVWCGNTRGNPYARRHVSLNPDRDPEFWDFTINEHGINDLPSQIDFVLATTGAPKLNLIGHSQGTTITFVLGSSKPEYNDKINVFIAMAPVTYLQNIGKPLSNLAKIIPEIYRKGTMVGVYELPSKGLGKFLLKLCSKPFIGYVACVLDLLFPLTGFDVEQLEPSFLRTSVGHFPVSTSIRNVLHFYQLYQSQIFARFDYGREKNLEVYGSETPPTYDLTKVAMPVVLLVGNNDLIATVKNVAILRSQLPNVARYAVLDYKEMNHLDFTWGRNMDEYLFPYIFNALREFNGTTEMNE